jgi:glycosyltransferase involved in cell wall biosynthesis
MLKTCHVEGTGMAADTAGPRVSIVLPTHNRAHLLGRAVESVIAQTHRHWELIVVDDGSSDRTGDVLAAFRDDRIRCVRNPSPLGPARARNTGILAAGPGEYLGFLDDDDEWLPRKLELQLERFRVSPVPLSAVGCGLIYHDDGGDIFVQSPLYRGDIFEHLLARRARGYAAPLILVRRVPGRDDILFDADLPCLEDAEFSMRVALGGPVDFVAEPLVKVYRNDGGPHVWSSAAAIEGYECLARKYQEHLRSRPSVFSYYQVCMARDLARLGRMAECRRRLRQAVAGNTSRARIWLWYAAAAVIGAAGVKACDRLLPIKPPPFSV